MLALAVLALPLLGLCACGETGGAPGAGPGTAAPAAPRPPAWCAARDEGSEGALLLDVKAASACRLLVRIVGVPEGVAEEHVRELAAGESVRLWAGATCEDRMRAGAPVSVAELAEGRTEPWLATLSYGWADGNGGRRTQVVGTRPGRGKAVGTWLASPPRTPATLEFGRDLDVAAAAVADGEGPYVLEGREEGSRVRGPREPGAGDRVTLLRIVVRAEKMGA
ncbi:MAG: hypothetical protein ACKOSS_00630 [Planctomycetia bacterium]